MTKKSRKSFTKEQKERAVTEYISGKKTPHQIASELDCDVQSIYRWKTLREEKSKGLRLEELMDEGNTKAMAEKLLEKELEIEMYQKKIAEQSIIIDLLKKFPTAEVLARESELTGLIKTTKLSAQKKKRAKR
mgnify:CR=1 FL=1